MGSTIMLAAIHSYYPKITEAANPASPHFEPDAPAKFVTDNLERLSGFLHEAGKNKVDLVATHEDIQGVGYYLRYLENPQLFASLAEEIPGPISRKIGEIAKKYGMHIAVNYYEKDGGEIYNTSVLIGRTGEFIGKYRKIQLPAVEKWMVSAGNEYPVFDTDIGRIGFVTCYDMIFPEPCRAIALRGADIIIHQTQGWGIHRHKIGEALVRVRAAENSVYLVIAKNITSGGLAKSCIIDNEGEILAEEPGDEEKIVIAEVVPDFDRVSEHYESLFSGVSSVRARIALERQPALYSILTDEKSELADRFKGMKLSTSPDDVKEVYRQWKEHEKAVRNNKPVKVNYHWNR